jgi:hypothetical protein
MIAGTNYASALTEDERRLIGAYRKADRRGRLSIVEHAEGVAEDWPAPRPRPLLALVPISHSLEGGN